MDAPGDRSYSRAPELEDLLSLCRSLDAHGVRYCLIGGFAIIIHGFVRATKDIDLLVDPAPRNILALKQALAYLPDNAAALISEDEIGTYKVVRIADEIVIDLLGEACGVRFEDIVAGGIERIEIEGVEIPVASKETLIRTKNTIRESDIMDVRFLRMRIEEDRDQGSSGDD